MSNETPCPSKRGLSPGLLSTGSGETMPRIHGPPPHDNNDWRSPSLFLAAASLSQKRTSLLLGNCNSSQLLRGSMSTPWSTNNYTIPSSTRFSMAPTPLPLLTPFLSRPAYPKPALFSPIRGSVKKEMSLSPTILDNKESTTGEWNGRVEKQPKSTKRFDDPEFALPLLATKQPKSPLINNEDAGLPTNETKNNMAEIAPHFNQYDVLFGQGPKPKHVNKEFRRLLEEHFTASIQAEKSVAVQSIIEAIKSKGGRFLTKANNADGTVDQHVGTRKRYRVLLDDDEIYKKVLCFMRNFNGKPQSATRKQPPNPTCDKSIPRSDVATDGTAKVAPPVNPKVVIGSHPGEFLTEADSLVVNVKSLPFHRRSKENKKRQSVAIVDSGVGAKRVKRGVLPPSSDKGRAAMALPTQLEGVRVSVTKNGSFEVRYKATGQGKKVCPKYIASAGDRATAISIGNVFATLLKENPEMTFTEAKHKALRQHKQPDEDEKENPFLSASGDNLVRQIVDDGQRLS